MFPHILRLGGILDGDVSSVQQRAGQPYTPLPLQPYIPLPLQPTPTPLLQPYTHTPATAPTPLLQPYTRVPPLLLCLRLGWINWPQRPPDRLTWRRVEGGEGPWRRIAWWKSMRP